MSTIQFITAVILIAIIVVVAYLRYRKEQKIKNGNGLPKELQQMLREVEKLDNLEDDRSYQIRLPSGRYLPKEDVVLGFQEKDIQDYVPNDQFFLMTYFGKRCLSERDAARKQEWERLYNIVYRELCPFES